MTRAALALSALLLLRPGEWRQMERVRVDFETSTLTVPAEITKRNKVDKASGPPHVVPLAPQAVDLLFCASAETGVAGVVDVRTLIEPSEPSEPLKAMLTSKSTTLSIGGFNDLGVVSLGDQSGQAQGSFVSGAVVLVPKNQPTLSDRLQPAAALANSALFNA